MKNFISGKSQYQSNKLKLTNKMPKAIANVLYASLLF